MHLKKIIYTCLIVILSITAIAAHQFYISLSLLNYNQENKQMEVSVKLFIDDIEKALNQNFHQDYYLGTDKEIDRTKNDLEKYILSKFYFMQGSDTISLAFLGHEYEDDLCWVYLESEMLAKLEEISVHNSILCEVYPEQKNILQLKIGNTKFSGVLDESNPIKTFNIKE